MKSIFERYGGFAKVSRVVSSFYDAVLHSSILSPYFRSVDMRRLIDHQTKFIAYLMGGPASFTNDHIARVHAHLGITDEAFDEAMGLMRETLEDHDYQEADISDVIGLLHSRRPYVVIRETAPTDDA